MSDTGHLKCPRCGKELPPSAPEGLCPACLGALNFATETEVTGMDAKEALPPLSPAELAPHFPQLEILECLGRGGMGVVYKARQKSLNRLVALKLLAPERVQDAKFAGRFEKEAQALALLNHPNIVTVHDFGQAGGYYFLLMEFVDGVNLRQLLRSRKLQPAEALAIVPPVCEALQYAHEHGIVHRDIKPENLLLAKDGRVKIADFGIAKMLGSETSATSSSLASTGGGEAPGSSGTQQTTMGTPQYMAPEQREHPQAADHRADIYSLGVVLYELLTGELPADKLQPPSSRVRGIQIDVRLDEIVLRALEKTPELRYQTAGEFRTQVETVANPAGVAPLSGGRRQILLKAGRCYLTTREKLGTVAGQMFLYRDKAELVLDDHQIAFIEVNKTTVIPLAAIRALSIGRFPISVNPAGLDFISLVHEEGGQSRELIFAPCESLFGSPDGFNAFVAEWHTSIRHAVQSATGTIPPDEGAAEARVGTGFSFVPAVLLFLAALIVPLMWFSVDRQVKQAEAMTRFSKIQSAQSEITHLNQRLGEANAAAGRAAARAGDSTQNDVTRQQARAEQTEQQRRADSLSREIAKAQRDLAKLNSQPTVPNARFSFIALFFGAGLGIAGLVAFSRALRSTGSSWSFSTLVAFVASLFAAAIAITVFLQTFRIGALETLLILGVLIFLFGKSGVMTRWPLDGWMRLLAWMDFILAIPVIILGVFFLMRVLHQADDWHPTPAEAFAVPLTWLAAVLLPWAAMRLRRPVMAPAADARQEKRSHLSFATMVVTFYAGMVLGVLLIGVLPFRFSRDSAYLLLVGIMAVASPITGVLAGNALRRARERGDELSLNQSKGWLKALSIVAWILSIPVVGFAIFFLVAMLSSSGGWNPAVSEAVLVPLTWLGAVLLPWAAREIGNAGKPSRAAKTMDSNGSHLLAWLAFGAAFMSGLIPTVFHWFADVIVPGTTAAVRMQMLWLGFFLSLVAIISGLLTRRSKWGMTGLVVGLINAVIWVVLFFSAGVQHNRAEVQPAVTSAAQSAKAPMLAGNAIRTKELEITGVIEMRGSISMHSSTSLEPGERVVSYWRKADGSLKPSLSTYTLSQGRNGNRSLLALSWILPPDFHKETQSLASQLEQYRNGSRLVLTNGLRQTLFTVTNVEGAKLYGEMQYDRQVMELEKRSLVADIQITNMFIRHTQYGVTVAVAISVPPGCQLRPMLWSSSDHKGTASLNINQNSENPKISGSAAWVWPGAMDAVTAAKASGQIKKLISLGSLQVRFGRPTEVFSVTNATGEVFNGSFELVGNKP